MFITVHATAAAIIGKHIANPFLAFILAVVSHFALDTIPHGDQHLGKKLFGWKFRNEQLARNGFTALAAYGLVDFIALIYVVIYLFDHFAFTNPTSVAWAIIGGILPDIVAGAYMLGNFKIFKKFFDFHLTNHHLILKKMKDDIPLWVGLILQFGIFIITFVILKS